MEPFDGYAPEGNGELVLVIDDEKTRRMPLIDTLERFGYRPLDWASPEAARQAARDGKELRAIICHSGWALDGALDIVRRVSAVSRAAILMSADRQETDRILDTFESGNLRAVLPRQCSMPNLLIALHEAIRGFDSDRPIPAGRGIRAGHPTGHTGQTHRQPSK